MYATGSQLSSTNKTSTSKTSTTTAPPPPTPRQERQERQTDNQRTVGLDGPQVLLASPQLLHFLLRQRLPRALQPGLDTHTDI